MKGIDTTVMEDRVAEVGDRLQEAKDQIRERAETAQYELRRKLGKMKVKANDLLDDGRHEIKGHPLTAVAAFAGAGLLVGFVAGLLVGNRKRF